MRREVQLSRLAVDVAEASRIRAQLLDDAERAALVKAVGSFSFLDQDAVQQVITKLPGLDRFVSDSEVVSESQNDGLLTVHVAVTMDVELLVGQLASMDLVRMEKAIPVRVRIREAIVHRPLPDPAAQSAVVNLLRRAGFRVRTDSDRRYRPTYTLLGEAVAEVTEGLAGEGIWSSRARVEVPVRDSSGHILKVVMEHASAADVSPGIAGKRSLEAAGGIAGKRICGILLTAAYGGTR